MAIPDEILKVERPTNTKVQMTKNGSYMVIERTGCRYDNGRRIPIEGKVVGHIVDGKYVAVENRFNDNVDLKSFADIMVFNNANLDLIKSLRKHYSDFETKHIYTMALLRAVYPGVRDSLLNDKYRLSFASELYPNLSLSKDQVSKYIHGLGESCNKIQSFMQDRVKDAKCVIAIDGMLKSNNSKVNNFSDLSFKGRIKNCDDLSIMYAFNTETCEPIAEKVYPGNMIDSSSFEDFLEYAKFKNGAILIGDKGIFKKKTIKEMAINKKMGYLCPLKRNNKEAFTLNLYDMNQTLDTSEKIIFCKKVIVCENNIITENDLTKDEYKGKQIQFYYAFRDEDRFEKAQITMGTIVFESNKDLTPLQIWETYSLRWLIELMFDMYKNGEELDTVREHDDYSVIGSEFINFIATLMTARVSNLFKSTGLYRTKSYKALLDILHAGMKVKSSKTNWSYVKSVKLHDDIFKILNV